MMPHPTPLAPTGVSNPHRTAVYPDPDVAAWDALQAAEIDCGEAEAALRAVDAADDQLGYAAAVAALAGARAGLAAGWVAYATLTATQDGAAAPTAGHGHVYAVATARRCVVCDQPDAGAAA